MPERFDDSPARPVADVERRYFFFDIDGTLAAGPLEQRYVPQSTQRTVEQLRARGHFVAIATGRAHALARPYMEQLGFSHMVCDGGNGMVLNGALLGIEPLPREDCIRVLDECERKGIPWAYSPDDGYERYSRVDAFDSYTHDSYMNSITVPDLDYRSASRFNKLFIACSREDQERIESLSTVPWVRFSPYVLFVEPIDKGNGIRRMMDVLGAPYSRVVVFGDGKNDISMFCPEWTSIAMGNAVPQLKELADYVTANVDADGIMLACKHFGWID